MAKYPSLMPSLALLFQLVESSSSDSWSQTLGLESTKRAMALTMFLEGHAKKVYAISENPNLARAHLLGQKIKSGKIKDGDTLRGIYRHHWTGLSCAADVEMAVAELERCHWLHVESRKQATGASSEVIRINPVLRGAS
jgi:putative DNA primase/helicase